MGLPMSITMQDIELAFDDLMTHVAMRGNDEKAMGQFIRDIGFDEAALNSFTNERGASLIVAFERNEMTDLRAKAGTLLTMGILVGFILGSQNPEAL